MPLTVRRTENNILIQRVAQELQIIISILACIRPKDLQLPMIRFKNIVGFFLFSWIKNMNSGKSLVDLPGATLLSCRSFYCSDFRCKKSMDAILNVVGSFRWRIWWIELQDRAHFSSNPAALQPKLAISVLLLAQRNMKGIPNCSFQATSTRCWFSHGRVSCKLQNSSVTAGSDTVVGIWKLENSSKSSTFELYILHWLRLAVHLWVWTLKPNTHWLSFAPNSRDLKGEVDPVFSQFSHS